MFYDGSPHTGDLAVNVLLGVTILWLPLTFAAIGRKAFVRYKITDKRISVATSAPWESRQTDVAYSQVQDVVAIGRGIGLWGDMVVTLKNGDKVEIRSLDKSDDTGIITRIGIGPCVSDGRRSKTTLHKRRQKQSPPQYQIKDRPLQLASDAASSERLTSVLLLLLSSSDSRNHLGFVQSNCFLSFIFDSIDNSASFSASSSTLCGNCIERSCTRVRSNVARR